MGTNIRPQLHGMWSAVSDSWAQHASFVDTRARHVTEWMISATTPTPGDRVLELACGPGALTLAVAPIVDPGQVVASDVADEMVDVAVARAHSLGLSNVHGRRLDLEDFDEHGDSFDVVYCRDGLQFALDPQRATHELARVLRPSGRAAIALWADRDRNPWLGLVLDTVSEQLGVPVPPPGVPGPFSLGDATRARGLFDTAGLADVRLEELAVPLRAPSFDGWWRMTTSLAGPLALILGGLDADSVDSIRSRAREAVTPFTSLDGSVEIPGVALLLSAHR